MRLALIVELRKVCSGFRSYNTITPERKFAFHGFRADQEFEEVWGFKDIEQAKRIAIAMQKTILEFFQKRGKQICDIDSR